jgi:hypothetical protein
MGTTSFMVSGIRASQQKTTASYIKASVDFGLMFVSPWYGLSFGILDAVGVTDSVTGHVGNTVDYKLFLGQVHDQEK